MEISVDIRYVYLAVVYGGLAIIFSIVCSVLFMSKRIGMWGVFRKAGEKEWKSIIPVYNQITLLKICKLKTVFILLYLSWIVPVIGLLANRDIKWITLIVIVLTVIYRFLIAIRLGQAFKKSDIFCFLHAFFPSILFPVIGCSINENFTEIIEKKK